MTQAASYPGQPLPAAASTALATSAGTALRPTRSSVPPGLKVLWYQRKETIFLEICVPDCEDPEVEMTDDGLIQLTAKNPKHAVTLVLKHRINSLRSRWWLSGRTLKFELHKAEYGLGHWDKLVQGEKLSNVLIDWTSWIDEAEENEIRNNPYGHNPEAMAGAMGGNWCAAAVAPHARRAVCRAARRRPPPPQHPSPPSAAHALPPRPPQGEQHRAQHQGEEAGRGGQYVRRPHRRGGGRHHALLNMCSARPGGCARKQCVRRARACECGRRGLSERVHNVHSSNILGPNGRQLNTRSREL